MAGKGRIPGSKNVNRNEVDMSTRTVTCDACGARCQSLISDKTKPGQHFDLRVPNAHNTYTYCNQRPS